MYTECLQMLPSPWAVAAQSGPGVLLVRVVVWPVSGQGCGEQCRQLSVSGGT